MAEIYTMGLEGGRPAFVPRAGGVADCIIAGKPGRQNDGPAIISRMGDPDLLQCVTYREPGRPGAVFAIWEKDALLFCAVAESDLLYAAGQGYFGHMVANARYGADVFENMEEPDD